MKHNEILQRYVSICSGNLRENPRIQTMLRKTFIFESFVLEHFSLGFSNGKLKETIGENLELEKMLGHRDDADNYVEA